MISEFNDIYKELSPNVPIFGTGIGDRRNLKSAIDLDKAILEHSSLSPVEQQNTKFNDPLFYLYTSGITNELS